MHRKAAIHELFHLIIQMRIIELQGTSDCNLTPDCLKPLSYQWRK